MNVDTSSEYIEQAPSKFPRVPQYKDYIYGNNVQGCLAKIEQYLRCGWKWGKWKIRDQYIMR